MRAFLFCYKHSFSVHLLSLCPHRLLPRFPLSFSASTGIIYTASCFRRTENNNFCRHPKYNCPYWSGRCGVIEAICAYCSTVSRPNIRSVQLASYSPPCAPSLFCDWFLQLFKSYQLHNMIIFFFFLLFFSLAFSFFFLASRNNKKIRRRKLKGTKKEKKGAKNFEPCRPDVLILCCNKEKN